MRVQMKISGGAVKAMTTLKKELYGDPNIAITNGSLVEQAYKLIEPDLNNINWREVRDSEVATAHDSSTKGAKTTFNLSQRVIDSINDLQTQFQTVFETKRVYKAYVVKLVLYAAILEQLN